ncbi:MAG TPA: class I SAM-dependent methyltransferase [Anaerolineales bacterium]
MNDPLSGVAEAFSRKAQVYDAFGAGHTNLERMRQKVRSHILAWLQPGDRILELNAGTGGDAVFFAEHGFPVHATDLSPGMVTQIEAKIAAQPLPGRLTVQQCSFLDLKKVTGGPYQCVFSNMGGVNCTAQLETVARGLDPLLAPGGFVTWVVMPPVCLWELAQVLRGDFRVASRRISPRGTLANVEGVRFTTYYYTPARIQRAFGPRYSRLGLQGLSVFTPPADHKDFPRRRPRLYRLLNALEERYADLPPFNRCGDFYILSLRRIQ